MLLLEILPRKGIKLICTKNILENIKKGRQANEKTKVIEKIFLFKIKS